MVALDKKRKIKLSPRTLRNIQWIEANLYIPDGRLVGQPFLLTDEQKNWMEMIYGSPTRMFINSMGRKNGKTSFSAALTLLHLVGHEYVPNGQLFSAAQSRDQASILFSLCAKMVRLSPTLSSFVGIRDTAKQLYCEELGTLYRALSADAATAYGLSPSLIIHDELGQVKGARSELFDALETAAGAQANPLSIVISTQAPTDADLLSILIDDALANNDPRIKCVLYTAPVDADPFAIETIKAANPHFFLMNQDEVLKQASDAQRMPTRQAAYQNLILNQRVEAKNPFVSRSVWQENGEKTNDLRGKVVYGGLDLSSVSDLTALILVSDDYDVESRFWLPEEGLVEKSRNDRVPYDIWAKEGKLFTTYGRSIEYEFVAHELRSIFDNYDIKSIAFDRYNMKHLKPWLEKAGFTEYELEKFVPFGQGYISMSPAIRELESLLLQKKLKHGNHPVLSMCAANAVTISDTAENRKFVKAKSTGRIDGMVALAMAVGIMPNQIEAADDLDGFLSNPIRA